MVKDTTAAGDAQTRTKPRGNFLCTATRRMVVFSNHLDLRNDQSVGIQVVFRCSSYITKDLKS